MDLAVVQYRVGAVEDDGAIASHFRAMWRDLGTPEPDIQPDWSAITLDFMANARQSLQYRALIAEVEGAVVGSVSGQLFGGLYPAILVPQSRQYGYIWGLYVEPAYRRQGIATRLIQLMVDYLRDIGCTKVVLNAAPGARSLYATLGFADSNLMELNLTQ